MQTLPNADPTGSTLASGDEVLAFLQKDYELKIQFLAGHYTRIWTRFNFFLVVETGLSIALFGWFKDKAPFVLNSLPIAVIGAAAALCWYCFGAQDRYLVEVYRFEVRRAARQLVSILSLAEALKALGVRPRIDLLVSQLRC